MSIKVNAVTDKILIAFDPIDRNCCVIMRDGSYLCNFAISNKGDIGHPEFSTNIMEAIRFLAERSKGHTTSTEDAQWVMEILREQGDEDADWIVVGVEIETEIRIKEIRHECPF